MRRKPRWRALSLFGATICALIGGLLGVAPAAAQTASILPHRAVYQLSMVSGHGGGDLADVAGHMAFAWADSCDGWTIDQRSEMTFLYAEGQAVQLSWRLDSWEAKDGGSYRFIVKQFTDGQLSEEFSGSAALGSTGGRATYERPNSYYVELPEGTLLPTAHSLALLERALAGERFFFATLFDGSDEQGLYPISAVMTELSAEARAAADQRPETAGVPGWNVTLAFYDSASDSAEPEHEQRLQFYANGLIDELVFDYGDFSVLARLVKLEMLPAPSC